MKSTTTNTTTILPRRLLPEDDDGAVIDSSLSASATADPSFHLINDTPSAVKTHFSPPTSSAADYSMALTILVLLTVIFFMAFFSLYIRRLTADDTFSSDYRRRNSSPPSQNNCKGVDQSSIRSLPLVACGVAAKHRIEECTICVSEFEEREIVKIIPYCKHVFHPKCIDTWLSLHVTCPVCRSPQLFENVDEVSLDVK